MTTVVRPLIGITGDLRDGKYELSAAYAAEVSRAGGLPVILPCRVECAPDYVRRCDGLILSGGGDPIMEQWAVPTHAEARTIEPERQAFETALLAALDEARALPVLGICLGMQLMGLHRGGHLEQYLPEALPTAGSHFPRRTHPVAGPLGEGVVHSHHRQALADPGDLRVVARSPDGVIEAIDDPGRPFYLGVQWHPERTAERGLGSALLTRLVEHARGKKDPRGHFRGMRRTRH